MSNNQSQLKNFINACKKINTSSIIIRFNPNNLTLETMSKNNVTQQSIKLETVINQNNTLSGIITANFDILEKAIKNSNYNVTIKYEDYNLFITNDIGTVEYPISDNISIHKYSDLTLDEYIAHDINQLGKDITDNNQLVINNTKEFQDIIKNMSSTMCTDNYEIQYNCLQLYINVNLLVINSTDRFTIQTNKFEINSKAMANPFYICKEIVDIICLETQDTIIFNITENLVKINLGDLVITYKNQDKNYKHKNISKYITDIKPKTIQAQFTIQDPKHWIKVIKEQPNPKDKNSILVSIENNYITLGNIKIPIDDTNMNIQFRISIELLLFSLNMISENNKFYLLKTFSSESYRFLAQNKNHIIFSNKITK